MSRFKVGDKVVLLGKYVGLHPGSGGVVAVVRPDKLRSIFDEYTVVFPPKSRRAIFDFQLVEDVSHYKLTVATLTSDSFEHPTPTHTRGLLSVRNILLQSPDLDIHIGIPNSETGTVIIGQILEKSPSKFLPSVEIRLKQGDVLIDARKTDELGEFRFSGVPKGSFTIEVLFPRNLHRIAGTFAI